MNLPGTLPFMLHNTSGKKNMHIFDCVRVDVAGTCVRDRATLVYGVYLQFNVDGHKEALKG